MIEQSAFKQSVRPRLADAGLYLIVMSACGHSRLQERIVGGVAGGILQSVTVPTMMSP